MAMPRRRRSSFALTSYGGPVEEIKRLLLEYAVMHDDEVESARLRAELAKLVEKVQRGGLAAVKV